jgi:DNA-binding beta-propeller fold protein YncE
MNFAINYRVCSSFGTSTQWIELSFSRAGIEYVATADGSVYAVINASPTKLFQVSFTPAGIAVDNVRGRVYLSSGSGNSIAVYGKTGNLLHTIN